MIKRQGRIKGSMGDNVTVPDLQQQTLQLSIVKEEGKVADINRTPRKAKNVQTDHLAVESHIVYPPLSDIDTNNAKTERVLDRNGQMNHFDMSTIREIDERDLLYRGDSMTENS